MGTKAGQKVQAKLGKGLKCHTQGSWLYSQALLSPVKESDKSELGLERWLDLQSR